MGESLWGDRLTYFSETRLSRLRINAGEDSPAQRGFTAPQSQAIFGTPATTTFEAASGAAGIPSGYRLRLDTRHEIQSPLKMGDVDVVPYAAGRATIYDDDFVAFAGEGDDTRLWGTLGLRAHTQFSKTFENTQSRVLDLHRLRHVIEPRVDLFWSGSTINPEDLPVIRHRCRKHPRRVRGAHRRTEYLPDPAGRAGTVAECRLARRRHRRDSAQRRRRRANTRRPVLQLPP